MHGRVSSPRSSVPIERARLALARLPPPFSRIWHSGRTCQGPMVELGARLDFEGSTQTICTALAGRCRPLQTTVDHCRPSQTIRDHCRPLQTIANQGYAKASAACLKRLNRRSRQRSRSRALPCAMPFVALRHGFGASDIGERPSICRTAHKLPFSTKPPALPRLARCLAGI